MGSFIALSPGHSPPTSGTSFRFNSLGPIVAWDFQFHDFNSSSMSCGDGFCFSRKGRMGGGGWVHQKNANSMTTSGLVSRSDLVCTGRAISVPFGINGVRNKWSYLVGPPTLNACFSAMAGWHFSQDLTRHLLIGRCGQSQSTLQLHVG